MKGVDEFCLFLICMIDNRRNRIVDLQSRIDAELAEEKMISRLRFTINEAYNKKLLEGVPIHVLANSIEWTDHKFKRLISLPEHILLGEISEICFALGMELHFRMTKPPEQKTEKES